MKFLHIADLHIGRRLGNISMAEDQRYILNEIIRLSADCDAVIIAGDLYNRPQPTGEAVRMAGDFLGRLHDMEKPVFLIAGNHDGGELVDYCGGILKHANVHAAGVYEGTIPRHVLRDEYGEVHVYLMPFVKPLHVRKALKLAPNEAAGYEDAVRRALEGIELDADARNVLVAHQYVSGAETCQSEERAIGGLDQISADVFAGFDYVALGHLHSPQRLMGGRVCYSGSPLKYSLSEEKQKKGAIRVTLGEKGAHGVEVVPLVPMRDMRTVEGPLHEIAAPECFSRDFVYAVVTDELLPADPQGALRTVYPNLMGLRIMNSRTNLEIDTGDIQVEAAKDPLEHFIDFYTMQNNQTPPDERRLEIMREIIEKAKEDRHAPD